MNPVIHQIDTTPDAELLATAHATPVKYDSDRLHEHADCIRIAARWLSAQEAAKGPSNDHKPIKHMIEAWAGRYVSQHDVEVAASLLGIKGSYPNFYISSRRTFPHTSLLDGVGQAFAHSNYLSDRHDSFYKYAAPEYGVPLKEAISQHIERGMKQ